MLCNRDVYSAEHKKYFYGAICSDDDVLFNYGVLFITFTAMAPQYCQFMSSLNDNDDEEAEDDITLKHFKKLIPQTFSAAAIFARSKQKTNLNFIFMRSAARRKRNNKHMQWQSKVSLIRNWEHMFGFYVDVGAFKVFYLQFSVCVCVCECEEHKSDTNTHAYGCDCSIYGFPSTARMALQNFITISPAINR